MIIFPSLLNSSQKTIFFDKILFYSKITILNFEIETL